MWCLWILAQFALGIALLSSSLKNVCNRQVDCDECITTDPGCAYCIDADFTPSRSGSRCSLREDLHEKGCINITFPFNDNETLEAKAINGGSADTNPIQVYPQHIKVKLRPGMEFNFSLTYRVPYKLPIDIYFVLDMSVTMTYFLKALSDDIDSLLKDMEPFTSDIRIGFGTFIDKRMSPFDFTTKEYLENPCIVEKRTCAPDNEFTHRQKLSNNLAEIKEKMKSLNASSGWDVFEGGFDGIMQAVVCQEEIGWRNESRRVLVYVSDTGFHFAGDGKLAGIVLPNDAKCHLDSNGIYVMENIMDYPSLGQMAKVLDDNEINVLFAVDRISLHLYADFCEMASQAKAISFDKQSSQKMQQGIVDYFKDLVNRVEIVEVDKPENMDIVIRSKCLLRNIEERRECTGLERGTSVVFEITAKVTKCPLKKDDFMTTFYLKPAGIKEKLRIDVEYICSCNCLDINDDSQCTSGNGTLRCGMCKCLKGRVGDLCQCTADKSVGQDTTYLAELCKNRNETGEEICSLNGKCQCGVCLCNRGYKGHYCQCNSEKCPRGMNGQECGGKGRCDCETCQCESGYTGDSCDCPESQESCKNANGKICDGNGKCVCGKCQCDGQYTLPFCEKCPTCNEQNCIDVERCAYAECVKCYLDRNDTCLSFCKNVTEVEEFPEEKIPCIMYLNQSCTIKHLLHCTTGKGYVLQVSSRIVCVLAPNILLIVLPILAGIIGVGLVNLIIWRLLASLYDIIEYRRFQKEVDNPIWRFFRLFCPKQTTDTSDSDESSDDPITEEHINHVRLCNVLTTVCGDALRKILKTHVPVPYANIYQAIIANKANLTSRRQIRPGQWQNALLNKHQTQLVFPNTQGQNTGRVEDFDISLLYLIIRNVSSVPNPTTGWGNPPTDQPRDTSLGANVERIRLYRNSISGHSIDGTINQQEFEDYWNKIGDVLHDIANVIGDQGYQKMLQKRKNQVITTYEASEYKKQVQASADEIQLAAESILAAVEALRN